MKKIRKTGLVLIGLIIAIIINGQTIKIQGGTSISRLDWQLRNINTESFYKDPLIGYSFFAGLDYLDKHYFNLSSNIGMIRKGGKSETQLTFSEGEQTGITFISKPTLDYLSVNTMIDLKYPIKQFSPFISFGPRIDYLLSSSDHFDVIDGYDGLNTFSVGLLLGGGLKYDIYNFQFGIRADYYVDFTKVADWTIPSTGNGGEISVHTITINLTIGYKLKK